MSSFLEKLCCCCSIEIGGYILGIIHLTYLVVLIYVGFDFAEYFEIGVGFYGKGFVASRIFLAITYGLNVIAAIFFIVGLKKVKIRSSGLT